METKQKFMTIFSQRLAGYLMMNGFVLMGIRDHVNGSGKKVFYFTESPQLKKAMEEYKKMTNTN